MSLSRLKLSAEDEAALAKDLPAITAFVGQLKAISARQAPAAELAPTPGAPHFRPDGARPEPWPLAEPTALIAMSPRHRDNFVSVPHVFS